MNNNLSSCVRSVLIRRAKNPAALLPEDAALIPAAFTMTRPVPDPYLSAFVERRLLACMKTKAHPVYQFDCAIPLFKIPEIRSRDFLYSLHADVSGMNDLPPRESLSLLPFRATYDTQYGGLQDAGDIAACVSSLVPVLREDPANHAFLASTLVDTLRRMNSQIYEHYRVLVDAFRSFFTDDFVWPEDSDTDILRFCYAIYQGNHLYILDQEKWDAPANKQFAAVTSRIFDDRGNLVTDSGETAAWWLKALSAYERR